MNLKHSGLAALHSPYFRPRIVRYDQVLRVSLIAVLKTHKILLIKCLYIEVCLTVKIANRRGIFNHQHEPGFTVMQQIPGQPLLILPVKLVARIRTKFAIIWRIQKMKSSGCGLYFCKKASKSMFSTTVLPRCERNSAECK